MDETKYWHPSTLEEQRKMWRELYPALAAGKPCPICGCTLPAEISRWQSGENSYGDVNYSITVECVQCGNWARARACDCRGDLVPQYDSRGYDVIGGCEPPTDISKWEVES